jgi:hypothetical protein
MTFADRFTNWLQRVAGPGKQKLCSGCGAIVHYGSFNPNGEHTCNRRLIININLRINHVRVP